jgi:hypothetical protein
LIEISCKFSAANTEAQPSYPHANRVTEIGFLGHADMMRLCSPEYIVPRLWWYFCDSLTVVKNSESRKKELHHLRAHQDTCSIPLPPGDRDTKGEHKEPTSTKTHGKESKESGSKT